MFPIATPNRATMSIIGLYNYDNTLFDRLQIPNGVNRETVISNILDTCAEMELLYPDAGYLKTAIGYWSAKEQTLWQRVYEMETANYNPLENYDRYDNEVENTGRNRKGNDNTVVSGNTKTKANDGSVSTDTNIERVAGYNSETLVVNGQNTASNTANSTTENNTTGTTVQSHNDNSDENENRVKSLHSHGNIGVTTVMQMAKEAIDVLPEINTVNVIAESFKRRFCLLVY